MEAITEKEFRSLYKLAKPSDFKLNQVFYRMTPSGDGFVPEPVKLTGNLSKDATKFNDMATRSQAFLPTSKAPKKIQSKKHTPAYVAPKTSELTSRINKVRKNTQDGLTERAESIKRSMRKK